MMDPILTKLGGVFFCPAGRDQSADKLGMKLWCNTFLGCDVEKGEYHLGVEQ